MRAPRDFNAESHDNSERDYRYGVDHIVRDLYLARIAKSEYRISPHSRVLEIGSHDGSMSKQILEFVESLDLLEPVVELHGLLYEKFGNRVTVHNGTIENNNFDGEFDAIFLVHVLEHIENPIEAIRKISSWLKPSGVLHVMVPNANALSRQLARNMGLMKSTTDVLEGEKLQGHLRTYTMEHLQSDITEAGMQVTYTGGVLHKPLANFQLDQCLNLGIIEMDYIRALEEYAQIFPAEASSIFVVASR